MRIFNKVTQNIVKFKYFDILDLFSFKKGYRHLYIKKYIKKNHYFQAFPGATSQNKSKTRESSAIQDLWKFCSFYNNLCTLQKVPKTFNNTD